MMKPYECYDSNDFNVVYDAVLLVDELERNGISRFGNEFDGDCGWVSFLTEKIEQFEEYWYKLVEDDNWDYSVCEAMEEFVNQNAEKWKRELRGDHRYKIKVVLELDVEADEEVSLDNIIGRLDNSIYVGDADNWELKDRRIINAIGKEVTNDEEQ